MMYYGYGGGFMWLLLIVVIGLLLYLFIQSTKTKGSMGGAGETPLDILKKRYAKGELTKDEFDRMKRDLSE
jgi:putative membrane protein